jgi:tungstate transport system ATP-binding protein
VQVKVLSLKTQGPITSVTLDGPTPLLAVITRRSAQDMGLAEGDVVEATFKATALHILKRTETTSDAASA